MGVLPYCTPDVDAISLSLRLKGLVLLIDIERRQSLEVSDCFSILMRIF